MRGSKEGFTLVELMIAIALVAILAVIAGLNLHAYALNRNLKTAARDIVTDFALYKRKAVSENETYKITFDIIGSCYTIQKGTTTIATKRPSSFGECIELMSANFGNGRTVNFLSRGTVSPFGNVKLKNSRQSQATVKVNITGKTYVAFDIK
jgi:prepilin-type N-terminal cleavage/methylation domain-containing protein